VSLYRIKYDCVRAPAPHTSRLEFSVRDLPDAVFLNGNQKMRPLINFAFDARRVSV
jgi:hypothetical protein